MRDVASRHADSPSTKIDARAIEIDQRAARNERGKRQSVRSTRTFLIFPFGGLEGGLEGGRASLENQYGSAGSLTGPRFNHRSSNYEIC